MTDLRQATEDEIQEELTRRKSIKAFRGPWKVENPQLDELYAACDRYLDETEKRGVESERLMGEIFARALTALYGQGVWVFIDSITGGTGKG